MPTSPRPSDDGANSPYLQQLKSSIGPLADVIAKFVDERMRVHASVLSQKRWLNTEEAAAYCNLSPITMEIQRHKKIGPQPTWVGKLVRYALTDLDAYMQACRDAAPHRVTGPKPRKTPKALTRKVRK